MILSAKIANKAAFRVVYSTARRFASNAIKITPYYTETAF